MKYYGVWAVRSAASVCGHAEAWLKNDGEPYLFTTQEEAAAKAEDYNKQPYSPNVSYYSKEMELELAEDILHKQEQAKGMEMTGPC